MARYTVKLNYVASFTTTVSAADEGEAYSIAREQAEDADMNQFVLSTEKESQCNCIGDDRDR